MNDDLRHAAVVSRGVGIPPMTIVVKIDREREPVCILGSNKVGEKVVVRRITTESRAQFWALA